jgi:hypothetical protein
MVRALSAAEDVTRCISSANGKKLIKPLPAPGSITSGGA